MNRVTLAIGGAVVLALALGLYVVLSQANEAASTSAVPKIADAERRRSVPDAARRTSTERIAERPSAVLPIGAATDDDANGKVHVRDHRAGNPAPLPVPPVTMRPSQHRITPQLSSQISQNVRAAVAACAADVPKSARGAKPRLEGPITIAIKSGTATITTAALEPRDVSGVPLDDIKQCIAQKSIGATTPAGDEPDTDSYLITLSLRLP